MTRLVHTISQDFRLAALLSTILVLPFIILEAVNQPLTAQSIPALTILFGLLWLLPLAFIVTLTPIVRTVRGGGATLANPLPLVIRLVFLALLFLVWSGLLVDQMPCFLGVPNCD
jgi:hypothetical protein